MNFWGQDFVTKMYLEAIVLKTNSNLEH